MRSTRPAAISARFSESCRASAAAAPHPRDPRIEHRGFIGDRGQHPLEVTEGGGPEDHPLLAVERGAAMLEPTENRHGAQSPNAHATIIGSSSFQNAPPWDPARSAMSTSAPASRSASAQRVAFRRKKGSCVPATR